MAREPLPGSLDRRGLLRPLVQLGHGPEHPSQAVAQPVPGCHRAALFLGEQPGHVRRAEQEHFREAVQIRVPGEQGEAHGGVRPGGRQQENRGRPGVGGAGGRVHAGPPAAGALPAAWPSATVRMWFVWPSRARTAAVTR